MLGAASDEGELLLRALAERLALLGRVDLGQADNELRLVRTASLERVAIGDGDDQAQKKGAQAAYF